MTHFPQEVFTHIIGYCGESTKDKHFRVINEINTFDEDWYLEYMKDLFYYDEMIEGNLPKSKIIEDNNVELLKYIEDKYEMSFRDIFDCNEHGEGFYGNYRYGCKKSIKALSSCGGGVQWALDGGWGR